MPTPDYRNIDPATAFPRALDAMRNPGFIKSARYQEQQTRANRIGAHPLILEFSDKMVRRFAALHIPIFPFCLVRTEEDQQAAYLQGVSWDTPADGLWPHMAFAVDLIHGTYGWMDKPVIPHAWDVVGHIGKEVAHSMDLKVTWGGDFSRRKWDPAHWEMANWKDIAVSGDKRWHPAGEGALYAGT